MPPGTPYHSFALPYPIRVDSFTDTLHDLPPPYNRPPLHLLTHTHSDHLAGLASKSFAYRVICSPDTKEMLLRHEVYAERSLYDHEYRAKAKKTFGHLKVDPYVMPSGQKFFTGSRDLLHAIPLNTPTEFDISGSETVTITLIDANHCPGAVMFLIEGARGAVLHTGDFRAEPCSSEDLRIFVARREGTHAEATGLVKTLEAIYLDTACLLSPVVVPSKERAAQGIVKLMALFPSDTHFFINAWTWGYEDVLKAVAREFHCKIHFDRYKYSIYSHVSDPFLRSIGTRDAASTRFHACERFDRCSFVDVPPYDYGAKGAVAPCSKEGKKVVYVNAVNMTCARWEDYQANVRWRVSRRENVDSLLVPLSRHSPLPELMSFVSLFRPLHVVPNTLDASLDGLDWGAMSKMFAGCLSPVSTPINLANIMAPPCPLTCHPSVMSLPGPSIKWDPRTVPAMVEERHIDTAYSNLIGPGDAADWWGNKGGKKSKTEVLRAWIGTGRRKSRPGMRRHDVDQEEERVQEENVVGPSRLVISQAPRTPGGYARSDSCDSSDNGGSDDHARTAWHFFGVGELDSRHKTWLSPLSQSETQDQVRAGTLLTPTSSPSPLKRWLGGSNKGKERATEHASQSSAPLVVSPRPCSEQVHMEVDPLPAISSCTSPFVSFSDTPIVGCPSEGQTNDVVQPGSQLFVCLDNVALDPSQDREPSHHMTHHRGQSQRVSQKDLLSRKEAENNEPPSTKRQRIDREESKTKLGGKEDALQPEICVGQSLNTHMIKCGQDETCTSPHKPKPRTKLARTPTVPFVPSGKNDNAVSFMSASFALEVEEVLGVISRSSPAPTAVKASATISFPVMKRAADGGRASKTASFSDLGGGASSRASTGKGLASSLPSVTVLASKVVRADSLSASTSAALETDTHAGVVPVSPRTAAQRAERAERKRITEKLRLARPDRVVRARNGSRTQTWGPERLASSEASATDAMDAMNEDFEMDWDKSRLLAERVREVIGRGGRASEVLPRLRCLEGWYAERG